MDKKQPLSRSQRYREWREFLRKVGKTPAAARSVGLLLPLAERSRQPVLDYRAPDTPRWKIPSRRLQEK